MKRICVLVGALALAGCTDSIQDQLSLARSDLEREQTQLESTQNACRFGPERPVDQIREEALAEWDAAAAENLDDISPDQEWEIRKSLGAEMGLAPSEVNGWKDIYRSRAEQAKGVLKSREQTRKLDDEVRAAQQKAACDSVPDFEKVVESQHAEVTRLERALAEAQNSPGFFSYLGYTLGVLALLAGAIIVWGRWYDNGVRRRVSEQQERTRVQLEQIQLDGLLRQAEIFMDGLPATRRDAIVDAHNNRDLKRLAQLVQESAPQHLKEYIL